MVVAPGRVRLPDLDCRVAHALAVAVNDRALDADALPLRRLADQNIGGLLPARLDARRGGIHADVEVGARRLRGGLLEILDRHQFPSRLFSNGVPRRPRSTMSKR